MNPRDYHTVAELAAKYGVSARRVMALIQDGRFAGPVFVGRQWWIPRSNRDPRRSPGRPKLEERHNQ